MSDNKTQKAEIEHQKILAYIKSRPTIEERIAACDDALALATQKRIENVEIARSALADDPEALAKFNRAVAVFDDERTRFQRIARDLAVKLQDFGIDLYPKSN